MNYTNDDGKWWAVVFGGLIALAFVAFGIWELLLTSFAGDDAKAAGFLSAVLGALLAVGVAVAVAWAVVGMRVRLLSARGYPHTLIEPPGEVIEGAAGDARSAAPYPPARHALPPPKSYPAQPFVTARERQEAEFIYAFAGKGNPLRRIQISRAAAEHFITRCFPRVSRQLWDMGNDKYTEVVAFFSQVGEKPPLLPMGNSYGWRPGVTREDLFDWLDRSSRREATAIDAPDAPPPPEGAGEAF